MTSFKSEGMDIYAQAPDGSWVTVGKACDVKFSFTLDSSEPTTDEIIEDLRRIETDLR